MKRFTMTGLAVLAASVLVSVSMAAEGVLMPGDAAPKMEVSRWVKGQKVEEFAKDKVYVVEFWATWCGPCIQTIPHLTKLQKEYEGKVHFTGVSVFENVNQPNFDLTKTIDEFVERMGDQMEYAVAVDKYADLSDRSSGAMANNWMMAAKQNGIPTAFIVKEGKIQWVGHPARMDEPLKQVVEGNFDLAASRAEFEKQIQATLEQERLMGRIAGAQEAFAAGEKDAAGQEIDDILTGNEGAKMSLALACAQEASNPRGNKEFAKLIADKLTSKETHPLMLFYAAIAYEGAKEPAKELKTLETALASLEKSEELTTRYEGLKEAIQQRIEAAKKRATDGE